MTELNLTRDAGRSETEIRMELLVERTAQLEEDNLRLEEALRRNSRIFEDLLANGQAGITLTGPDRRIVKVIKAFTDIDAGSLTGRSIDSLMVPQDRQAIVDAYSELLQGRREKLRLLVRVPQADGTVVLYAATLTDMLCNPNIQGILWNYSTYPFLETSL
jgi:PAS domain S-box-containing protein